MTSLESVSNISLCMKELCDSCEIPGIQSTGGIKIEEEGSRAFPPVWKSAKAAYSSSHSVY